MKQLPSFWSILIPQVRYNKNLSWFDKVVYSEITALTNASGYCFANNSYFEFVFDVSKSTVIRSLNNLEKNNCIMIDIVKDESNQVIERKIYILIDNPPGVKNDTTPGVKNDTTPGVKNDTYNNTSKSNNTRFNNKVNKQFNNSFKNNQRPDVNPDWLSDYLKENE